MKILSREQIQKTDAFTIETEAIKSIDLMERAAGEFVKQAIKVVDKKNFINIFCGKGNNGGDGLVTSRLLIEKGFKIKTFIVNYTDKSSDNFDINLKRLQEIPKAEIVNIYSGKDFPEIGLYEIVIDAIWGTGMTKAVRGFSRELIKGINNSASVIIALDIPSGSFCDTFNEDEAKIKANYSFSFYPPKLSFFMPENENFMGNWKFLDIGLDKNFISRQSSDYYFISKKDIVPLLKKRNNFDHKGKFGHALIISGSYGKIGATVLASTACLRSGAGLVSTLIPECGYNILQTAVPEAMVFSDTDNKIITDLPDLKQFSAVGIGPGIGTDSKTVNAIKKLLETFKKPIVIDADGINILSQNKELLSLLPKNTILTPHIGEFERLVGKCVNHFQRIEKLKEFSKKYRCIVVLKGKYSAIATTNGKVFFNPTGNSGMASGGSGDVLTGIITALLAQNYLPENAAILSVYIHGLAGDIAEKKYGKEAMIARDIIEKLPKAFNKIQ